MSSLLNKKKVELLICGYTQNEFQQNKPKMNNNYDFVDIIKVIILFHGYISYQFYLSPSNWNQDDFKLFNDGIILKGAAKSCEGCFVYLKPFENEENEHKKKQEKFISIKNICQNEGSCYRVIVVTKDLRRAGQIYKQDIINADLSFDNYEKWKFNDILTVKLDSNNNNVTFYHNKIKTKQDNIESDEIYYVAVYVCDKARNTHLQIVETPDL